MNENEITLNNSDTDFVAWDMTRPVSKPKPGDWAYGLTDPFME